MAEVYRYALIKTNDDNPEDINFELGPVYTETAPTASSYLDAASADTLAASRHTDAAWAAATAADKLAALEEATRNIDGLILRGTKYDSDQALEFPRIIDGVVVGNSDQDAEVPDQVKWACLEEAIAIIGAGSSGGRQALQAQGVASYQIPGIISETFAPAAISAATQSILQSPRARQIMRRYMGAVVR